MEGLGTIILSRTASISAESSLLLHAAPLIIVVIPRTTNRTGTNDSNPALGHQALITTSAQLYDVGCFATRSSCSGGSKEGEE